MRSVTIEGGSTFGAPLAKSQVAAQWVGDTTKCGGCSSKSIFIAYLLRAAKASPFGGMIMFGGAPGNRIEFRFGFEVRHRSEQGPSIRVLRLIENLINRAIFDDLAGIHDRDIIGHVGNDTEVVGDENNRKIQLLLQVVDQVKDLGLDRDVQRRGRLIANQDLRIGAERDGDDDALAHASRELKRVLLNPLLRFGDADETHQVDGLLIDLQRW
jgi:hypothetical protein